MRNHLNLLMKRRKSWNNAKPLAERDEWITDLGLWYGLRNRFNRGLKPWSGVGESGSAKRFPARIKYHM